MMRLVPLEPDLLRMLPLRDPRFEPLLDADYVAAACAPGMGFAALDGGYILGAGGLVPIWRGRALAWMLPGLFARPRHLLEAARFGRGWLDHKQLFPEFRRLECQVLAGFARGRHFVEALGFVQETPPLEAWDAAGNDHIQFKRIAPRDRQDCQVAEAAD